METIQDLLSKLNNQVKPAMAKRLDGLQALQGKLKVAQEEHNANPTETSEEELIEIQEYIVEQMDDIVEDLKIEVRRKKFADEESKSNQPILQDVEKTNVEDKEEKGIGWGTLVFGGVLLVFSLGTINYFRNK